MNRPSYPILFSLTALPLLTAGVAVAVLALGRQSGTVQYAAILPLAYLIGSVPWGYLLLRWRRGVDVREFGSGRTGMSNVLRTGGGKMATAVLVLDFAKGVLAVLLAREIIGTTTAEVVVGLAVLAGHNWPVFLKFKGGRGIATGLGVLSMMAPLSAVIGAAAFIPITLISRYLSLGSIIGVVITVISVLALALAGIYSSAYTLYAIVAGAVIIWQHRDNIQRLLHGNEHRLGAPATKLT